MRLLDQKDPQNDPLPHLLEESLRKETEASLSEVEVKFQSAIDSLVQSYDEHMKCIIPKPKLLPIRVNVRIESKGNYKIENIHIKPYDNLNDLLKLIEEH